MGNVQAIKNIQSLDELGKRFTEAFTGDTSDSTLIANRDKVLEGLLLNMRPVVDKLGRVMILYSEKLYSEALARKHIKGVVNPKSKGRLQAEINNKLYERRAVGSKILLVMNDFEICKEIAFRLKKWCNEHKKVLPEMYHTLFTDIKNISDADIVRRCALKGNVPGGPKIMISVQAAKLAGKCCRRLNSNFGFVLNRAENVFAAEYEKNRFINEREERLKAIIEQVKEGIVLSPELSPVAYYRAAFAELFKQFNNQHKDFSDRDIVLKMIGAGYSDKAISMAVKTNSLYFVGRTDKVDGLIADCRKQFNANVKARAGQKPRTLETAKTERVQQRVDVLERQPEYIVQNSSREL